MKLLAFLSFPPPPIPSRCFACTFQSLFRACVLGSNAPSLIPYCVDYKTRFLISVSVLVSLFSPIYLIPFSFNCPLLLLELVGLSVIFYFAVKSSTTPDRSFFFLYPCSLSFLFLQSGIGLMLSLISPPGPRLLSVRFSLRVDDRF